MVTGAPPWMGPGSELSLGDSVLPSREAPVRSDPLETLWRRAQTGDQVATRQLLEAVTPAVFRIARGVLGDDPELDDVAQVALLALVRSLRSFRGDCQVVYFASRIAMRQAMLARRRSRRRARHADDWHRLTSPLDAEVVPATVPFATTRVERIWAALMEELPEAQASTIVLRAVLDYSLEETAATLQVPINTVRSRMRLARETLRRRLSADPALADLLEVDP